MTNQTLRSLIAERVDAPLADFARRFPHLAAAINRVALIESTVSRLADDPEYRRTMEQSAADGAVLDAAARIKAIIDRAIARALGL